MPPVLFGRANPSPNPTLARLPPSGSTVVAYKAPLPSSPRFVSRQRNPAVRYGKVSSASAADSGGALLGDAPLRLQGVRPFASPAAMDSDNEIMMEVLQEDES
jgi:hypothetical protein